MYGTSIGSHSCITEALLRTTLSYCDRCTPGLTHIVAELDLYIDILGQVILAILALIYTRN